MARQSVGSVFILGLAVFAGDGTARATAAALDRVREHVYFLASDEMRGRASGSPEYEQAARYVESHLEDFGLAPLFAGSYRQPFRLEQQVFSRRGWVEVSSPTGSHRFRVLEDAVFLNANRSPGWEGPFEMVYVGLGIHEPEAGWDDYAELDLAGKCALLVVDTPADLAAGLQPDLLARYADLTQGPSLKARAAAALGARCVLGILSPEAPAAMRSVTSDPDELVQIRTVDTRASDEAALPLAAGLSARAVRSVFAGQAGDPFPGGRPRGFALDGEVRFEMAVDIRDQLTTSNIGALLPGSDPLLACEVIVLSAHVDGQGMRGKAVLNSANDNASAVAALLEAARQLAGAPARRSLAFLFTAAEEEGLLGAGFFIDNPPVDLSKVALNINMEMIGKPARSGRRHRFRVTGRISRPVEVLARAVEQEVGGVDFDYSFRSDDDGRRLFRNADHVRFFLRGIPTLYFYGGDEGYHQPSDDPQRINYPKVAKMAEMLVALARNSDGWAASP